MLKIKPLKISMIAALLAAHCVAGTAGTSASRPLVYVSIPPQAWLVERLCGRSVEVATLLEAGANPHSFEPTARQLRQLARASCYLTIGMPFEASLAQRVAKLNPGLPFAAMDRGIAKRGAHTHGHGAQCDCAHDGDPHIWLAPAQMCAMASNSVAALRSLLPTGHTLPDDGLERTVAEIQQVAQAVRARLENLPTRTWVVYHPSWGYFADAYGLTLLAVEEEGRAPSAKHLAGVIRQARSAGVRMVFAEPQYDRRPVETLASQIGAKVATIDPLARDWPTLLRAVADKLAEP